MSFPNNGIMHGNFASPCRAGEARDRGEKDIAGDSEDGSSSADIQATGGAGADADAGVGLRRSAMPYNNATQSAAARYKLADVETVLGTNERAKVEIFMSVDALLHPVLGVVPLVVVMQVLGAIDKVLKDAYGTFPGLFSAGTGGEGARH
ncbi:hypothetical protein H0H87_001999 [Tephrocybe sp. NHM501043]|nr:hypothetical protein H0H87_001999 [Tephrocybe sp. NHM501043]